MTNSMTVLHLLHCPFCVLNSFLFRNKGRRHHDYYVAVIAFKMKNKSTVLNSTNVVVKFSMDKPLYVYPVSVREQNY